MAWRNGAADARTRSKQRLDAASAALEQIELSLGRRDRSVAELQASRAQIVPIVASVNRYRRAWRRSLNAAKTRLDQLGAPPGDKAPPEPAATTEARNEQQKLFNDIDATFRRAHLVAVQASQLIATIGAQRRVLFTRSLFERTSSVLSPTMWMEVLDELPRDLRAVQILVTDWLERRPQPDDHARTRPPGQLPAFGWRSLPAGLPVRSAARLAGHGGSGPDPVAAGHACLVVAVVTAAVPILAVLLVELRGRGARFVQRAAAAARLVGGGRRQARVDVAGPGARPLAPSSPSLRLIRVRIGVAERLVRLVLAVVVIVSAFKFIEAVDDAIAATLSTSVAARAVGALLVALAISGTLLHIGNSREDAAGGSKAPTSPPASWYGPARTVAWALVVLIGAAVLVGYVAFGAFLVDQIVWDAAVVSPVLLTVLADDGIDAVLKPTAWLGRAVVFGLGIRRKSVDQIGVLLSGLVRVALVVSAALLVLAPWGLQSEDLFSYLRAAFFGFTVGDVTISLSTIAVAVLLFFVGILATRGVQGWLDSSTCRAPSSMSACATPSARASAISAS